MNRSKNYVLKRAKLRLKLKLLSTLAAQGRHPGAGGEIDTNHIIIPFIGKGIGDAVVIGGMIDTLVKHNFRVSVIADKRTWFLFKAWRNLQGLYFYDPDNKKPLVTALKGLNPFIFVDSHEVTHSNVDSFDLIRRVKPHRTLGFTRQYRLYDGVINISQPLAHISTRYIDLLNYLGIPATAYAYSVVIPDEDASAAREFIQKTSDKKIIAFIPYGSVSERFFSDAQIDAILCHLAHYESTFHVIILGEQHKINTIPDTENVTKNITPSFFSAAQIIKESALVISPDTSFVHVARAFDKKLVCLYPYKILVAPADNADVWGPNYACATQIRLKERRVMDADIQPILHVITEQLDAILRKN
ncbi:glycosyltransferase family 9 protein [unidentified bacterial endosymbiont]|uniref:glycosyltransferase family 9 protein n=1 Tax=unidentified bacterial endosymbiont TaxID=2355 RepID=UPI00209C8712|nr:glycosyltransferase family 9 protein [unidentified bacterial endosymbiont]